MNYTIATFYHLVYLENYYDMQDELKAVCENLDINGTILLSEEGINATIAGSDAAIDEFLNFLRSDTRMTSVNYQKSYAEYKPFMKLKVRLKHEVVRLAVENLDMSQCGKYIEPEDWDEFISQPDIYLIDTRNDYEIDMGTFKGSINPNTKYFREFPKWAESWLVDKLPKKARIAMYCTGGVRCEKSTAYLRSLGFDNVYHLKGGILNYLKKTNNKNGLWKGECFVFDDRISLNSNLSPSVILCSICNNVCEEKDLHNISKGNVVCLSCSNIACESS